MRKLACGVLAGFIGVAPACGPRVVPVPVVTTPRFQEFVRPAVPSELALDVAARTHERAWSFLQAGDLPGAERELSLALKTSPTFYPAETALGYLKLARKEPKAALARFDRVLERRGDYASALVGRGRSLLALSREGEAIAAFEAAVAADGSLADLRRLVDVLKFRGLERDLVQARQAAGSARPEEAILLYRSAIASSPESPLLYRELAMVEKQQGDVNAALAHLRQAVELDPNDGASLGELGRLLEMRGEFEGALRAYGAALAIEPSRTIAALRDGLRTRLERALLPEEYRAIESAPQVTRADLAALIGVRLGPLLQTGRPLDAVVITDVRGSWAESWIMLVVGAGVIEPFANHTFQPDAFVERVDLAQAVSHLLDLIAPATAVKAWQNARLRFSDVATGHLAYPAALVAVASGVMTRGPDDSFQPSRQVTGAESSEVIDRLRATMSLADAADLRR